MSRVVAVSVSQPRWRQIGGRPVLTSIVRDPSPGPIDFGPDGPAGNRTSVHTEQVLAFAAEHYDYWTEAFQVPRASWRWCHWGENLTISDLDEYRLGIGDILEIAEVARFQVTSPRYPCFKLAWRLGQPDSVLRQIVESGRVGVYLSVLTPGRIAAGDKVRRVPAQGGTATVAEVARLLAGGEADAVRLKEVLALPALGDQARGMLTRRLAAADDARRLKVGRWKGWRPFEVVAVARAADEVRSFELAAADGEPIAPYRAGQFLTVRLSADEADAEPSRTWSLSDYQDQPEVYRLTIKRIAGGQGSGWMHDLVAGRRVLARPPAGRFTLDRGGLVRTVLISAGIGVTPLLAMLKAHAARGDKAPLLWLHATRNGATHVLGPETSAILRASGFARQVFYTAPRTDDRLGEDFDHTGRPTPERLMALIGADYEIRPFGRAIPMEGTHSDVYVCGPPPFEAMVRSTLLSMGVDAAAIRTESFLPTTGVRSRLIERAEVTFARSNLTAAWSLDEDVSLLELAESLGLEPECACRLGLCGSCEATLNEGSVDYDPRPLEPPPPGRVLVCCARPASQRISIDL